MWVDVDHFKSLQDDNQMKMIAVQLYERYWSPLSEYAIQIKAKIKEQLAERIEAGQIDSCLFDDALKELEGESYKKFLRSDVYAGFMADKGVFVRPASPKRRVSITELFKKKGADGRRRSSLCSAAWSASSEDLLASPEFLLDAQRVNSLGCLTEGDEDFDLGGSDTELDNDNMVGSEA